jgi:hypothetical protein
MEFDNKKEETRNRPKRNIFEKKSPWKIECFLED